MGTFGEWVCEYKERKIKKNIALPLALAWRILRSCLVQIKVNIYIA